MKRIISLTLAALMLVTLLLTATSCGMESMTGYTRLRDHVTEKADEKGEIALDGSALGFTAVKLSAPIKKGENKPESVELVAEVGNQAKSLCLTLTMTGSAEKAFLSYEIVEADGKTNTSADATVLLTHYTGNDLVEFTSVTNIRPEDEQTYRVALTSMLNSALKVLDTYTTEKMDMNVHELGFIVLSDKYMAPDEEDENEEDLGGAFSPARLSKAGLMILQGMGMVFLVLAILWLVLLIFKKVFYKDPAKEEKKSKPAKTEAPASASAPVVEAPVAVAPVVDDGALIAAITAAVSAYIESDPALTSQFAGGFRVVSFKPTTKSRNR